MNDLSPLSCLHIRCVQLVGVSMALTTSCWMPVASGATGPVPEPATGLVFNEPAPGAAPKGATPPIILNGAFWVAQGPGPSQGGQSENASPNNEVTGAVHVVLPHPTNPNILFLGGVNGGVWRTSNAQASPPSWTPLTDFQGSMSIGALAFDRADVTSTTIWAGIGRVSSFAQFGGPRTGLLKSSNSGTSWTAVDGGGTLVGKNISGLYVKGNIIVVSVNTADTFTLSNTGIFRSTDGGSTFTQISSGNGATTGLPGGVSNDLVVDPANDTILYSPINFADTVGGQNGIYKSTDSGATWAKVSSAAMDALIISGQTSNIELAAGPSGAVFVGIVNTGQLAGFFRSGNAGGAWVAMDIPQTNETGGNVGIHPRPKGVGEPGGQGSIHFSVAADPTDPNIVYVGGDRQPAGFQDLTGFPNAIGARDFSGRLFRGNASQAAGSQWVHLTHSNTLGAAGGGTASSSAPHADSRDMAFDAAGNLIEGDDGGIFRRTSPRSNTGDWFSIAGTAQLTEAHNVIYDGVSGIVAIGTQDNGTSRQVTPGGTTWQNVSGGDGGDMGIDTTSTPGFSIQYSSFQNLGAFRRRVYDSANGFVSQSFPPLTVTGGGAAVGVQFVTPIGVNTVAPARLIIGGNNSTYESLDSGNTLTEVGPGVNVNREGIIYGGRALGVVNPDLLYIGSGARIFARTNAAGTLAQTPAAFPGGTVRSMAIDPSDWRKLYAIDNNQVFQTGDAGATWTEVTGDLAGFRNLWTIRHVRLGSTTGLVVGTDFGVYLMSFTGPGLWVKLGGNLPNTAVYDMHYDDARDILVVSTMGRGVWRLSGSAAALPAISITDAAVTERLSGTTNAIFTVSLSPAPTQVITVDFATASGSAIANVDFVATSGTLTFQPGQSSQSIPVTVNSDTEAESNESFFVNLSNPVNATLSRAQGLGVIFNGEPPAIDSFTPLSGKVGSTIVTIAGRNFSPLAANNVVYFGAVRATVITASDTTLTVVVPVGATYAPITVSVAGFVAYSAVPFNVIFDGSTVFSSATFDNRLDFNTGGKLAAVVVGDFNNDGKPDLAGAVSNLNTVAVFRNVSTVGAISSGSFAARQDQGVGSAPVGLAVGDLDGDGKLDLVTANYQSATISILRNNSSGGNISFEPAVTLLAANNPRGVVIIDLDGDGVSDLAVANEGSSSVSIYRNRGASGPLDPGSFNARQDFIVGTQPASLAAGDLDRDGKADLVVVNRFNGPGGNVATVLRNLSTSGSVDFAARVNYATAAAPVSMVLGDINVDGKLDLITANSGNSSVTILTNNATPGVIVTASFVSAGDFPAGSGVRAVAVADANGDSLPDIVTVNEHLSTLSVLRNQSNPAQVIMDPRFTYGTAAGPLAVALADLDGDGKPELLSAGNSGFISIQRNLFKTDVALTWNTLAAIEYGTALSATQLNASAQGGVEGAFVYTPAAGTVLNSGNGQTLRVVFIPYDSVTYNRATNTVTIDVSLATLTVTADNKTRTYGDPNPVFTANFSGLQNNDNITALMTTTATATSPVTTAVPLGVPTPPTTGYPISVALSDPNNRATNYNVTLNDGQLNIDPAPLSVVANNATRGEGQPNPAFTGVVTGIKNNEAITGVYTSGASPASPPGPYVIDAGAQASPSGLLANYTVNGTAATLTVTANANPALTLPGPALTYTENAPPILLDATATLVDTDGPLILSGQLTVSITANGTPADRLSVRHVGNAAGQIGVADPDVSYGGTVIATIAGGTSGTDPLIVTFNANASPVSAQAVLRNVTYHNISEDPSTLARTTQVEFTDGFGGSATPGTKTINVIAVNDLPLITLTSPVANASYKAPGPVLLIAQATDLDGAVTQVEFFRGFSSLGVVTQAPYQLTLNNVAVGDYNFSARATDNQGGVTVTPTIPASVNPAIGNQQVSVGGHFELNLFGVNGVTYNVEVSTDLVTWTKIAEVRAGAGATPFLDLTLTSAVNQRFYRFRPK